MSTTVTNTPPVETPTNRVRDLGRALVQIAHALPETDDGWSSVPYLTPLVADEGWGAITGTASFAINYGVIKRANYPRWLSYGAPFDDRRREIGRLLSARWCRILKTDPDGSVILGTGALAEPFTPLWWGVFGDEDDLFGSQTNRDVSGSFSITATGIISVLEDIWPTAGYGLGFGGAIVQTGGLLVFNGAPDDNGMVGNASTIAYLIRATGGTCKVFDIGSGNLWTAREAVEHLLEVYTRRSGSALRFVLAAETGGDLDALLGYSERWDLRGLNIGQMLSRIINSRRGLGYRTSVSGTVVTIHVDSAFAEPITVGSKTIPANQQIFDLDVRGTNWLHTPRLVRDSRNVVDDLILEGDAEVTCMTLEFRADAPRLADSGHGDVVLSFSDAEATAWDAATDDQRKAPLLEGVWRELELAPDWSGSPSTANSPSVGLSTKHRRAGSTTDLVHGFGGIDELQRVLTGGAADPPPAGVLRFERLLPIFTGVDYVTLTDAQAQAVSTTRSLVEPMVFYSPTGAAPWSDISDLFQLTTLSGKPGFQLGKSAGADQAAVRALLTTAGAVLRVTVAISGPMTIQQSWRRDPSQWPRADRPRELRIPVPALQRWRVCKGAALGVDATGALVEMPQDLLVRDDTPQLKQLLVLSKPWQTLPRVELSWTERGTVDNSNTRRPGALCAFLDRGDKAEPINGVVTRRKWDFQAWTTTRTTQRPLIDVGTIA